MSILAARLRVWATMPRWKFETKSKNDDAAENGLKPDADISSEIRPGQRNIRHRQERQRGRRAQSPKRLAAWRFGVPLAPPADGDQPRSHRPKLHIRSDRSHREAPLLSRPFVKFYACAPRSKVHVRFEYTRNFAQGRARCGPRTRRSACRRWRKVVVVIGPLAALVRDDDEFEPGVIIPMPQLKRELARLTRSEGNRRRAPVGQNPPDAEPRR